MRALLETQIFLQSEYNHKKKHADASLPQKVPELEKVTKEEQSKLFPEMGVVTKTVLV